MIHDYPRRPLADSTRERRFLERRLVEVERDMGRLAARLGAPTPITQELDVFDRARELVNDMLKQVHVRPLDEAIAAQLDWLGRVEERHGEDGGEPKTDLNRIALDRRLLEDLHRGWRAEAN